MTELNKYKICPACQEHNPPWLLECRACETDLTAIRLTDADALPVTPKPESPPEPAAELMRRCDCGVANAPQQRKCTACGEDISDIAPEICGAPLQPSAILLETPEGATFTINKTEYVLGREAGLADYLTEKNYVSRRHAKLNVCDGSLFLENLSATNPTFLNNQKVPENTPVRVQHNDEIGLGGKRINGHPQALAAYFTVKIKP